MIFLKQVETSLNLYEKENLSTVCQVKATCAVWNQTSYHFKSDSEVRLIPTVNCSVKEAGLGVGELGGYGGVKSAPSLMVQLLSFLISKVNNFVERGVIFHDTSTPVLQLVSPARNALVKNRLLTNFIMTGLMIMTLRSTDIIDTAMNIDQYAYVFDIHQKNETTDKCV